MKALLALLMLFSISVFAREGGVTSGGGYGVLCYENSRMTKLKSVQLLDFYKAEFMIKNFKLRELPEGKTIYDKAEGVLKRIETFSPQIFKEWQTTLREFRRGKIHFVQRGSITEIDDGKTPVTPEKNCRKIQIAVQFKEPKAYEHWLLVDEAIWSKMDELNQIGLLVHETIYRTAMLQGHENSDKVHYLTAMLFSEHTQTLNTDGYLEVFKSSKIDGCFNKSLEFTVADQSTPVVHDISFDIRSYDKHKREGTICERQLLMAFPTKDHKGFLSLEKEMRIVESLEMICFYANDERTFFQLNKQRYGDGVCLSRSTTPAKSPIVGLKDSSLPFAAIQVPSIKISRCSNQMIDDFLIVGCKEFEGVITLAGKEYALSLYTKVQDRDIYFNPEPYSTVTVENQLIPFIPIFNVAEDGSIYIAPSEPGASARLKGQNCQFHRDDWLEFSPEGEFRQVIRSQTRMRPITRDIIYCSDLFR